MFSVMEHVIAAKIGGVSSQVDFCVSIGYSPSNIPNIRNGKQSFSNEHIRLCCEKYNVSADYIYGFTNKMNRVTSKQTPIQKIEEALRELKSLK